MRTGATIFIPKGTGSGAPIKPHLSRKEYASELRSNQCLHVQPASWTAAQPFL